MSLLHFPMLRGGAPVVGGGGGDFLLDAGHYVDRISNMVIEHPRPSAETNSYAQHRNAYPGIPWSTRICVRDGAWPFYFEVDATSASKGITVGAQFVVSGDMLVAPADYALVEWDNPTTGTHTITVSVYDQEYDRGGNPSPVATISWDLVVGTSAFVFIDPVSGSDSNAGTLAEPFATIEKLHADDSSTTTYAGKNVYLRAGTHDFDGMATNGGNYAMFANAAPCVFIGYPGESVTLSMYEGWVVGRGADDIMFKDLSIVHASEFSTKMHFYATVNATDRVSFHNVEFSSYYAGSSTGSENPACFYTTTGGTTTHLTISGCTFTGQMGAILTSYMLDGGVFELNNIHTVNTTGQTDPSNDHDFIYLKDSTRNFTVRANNCWDGITTTISGFVGCGGQNDGGYTYSAENIVIEYNKLSISGQSSIDQTFEYGSSAASVYMRRNSCGQDINHGNAANYPTTYTGEANAIVSGYTNMPGAFVDTGSVTGSAFFDANMALTGTHRTNYLGTKGAEVA